MTRRHTARAAVGRLRGWGGVTCMAVACAVTASLTLLPLRIDSDPAGVVSATRPGTAHATTVRTTDCDPWTSVPASAADGKKIEEIKKRGHLIVGVDQNSFNWGYRDPTNNRIQGFDIDLAKAIAADILPATPEDERVVFRVVSTADRVKLLETGDVDIVVRTMTIDCAKHVAFSLPYFTAGQQVLAPKSMKITGYDASLVGKRVCTADGSSARKNLERLRKGDRQYGVIHDPEHVPAGQSADGLHVPNQLDCLVRLQLGEVAAVITDDALAAAQIAQDPSVEFKGTTFTEEYYGVAANTEATDLVARINQVLAKYTGGGANGPWTTSYNRWLEKTLPGKVAPTKPSGTG
ncbi:glutamate ABC transporter substrate-binding protein [Streptomyces sp. NPDC014734]|uniref:glutamate ABC transporter substrate-binding protein n=1 Tax=Streptomyces sp. NPDC014734 TaxID=3364886 RepID=UPI0036F6A4F6